MISGQFTARINQYLESTGKQLDQVLLDEAGKRIQWAFKRQTMQDREEAPGVLRMSSGGQCVRKLWYRYNGVEGEPLGARVINTFLMGDICEVGLSILGRLAGWQLMGKPDGEDEIKISLPDGSEIKGHPDDVLYVPEEKEYYLIEYKTMSEYGFREFEKNGIDDAWGYKTQISLYCKALGFKKCILIGMCKNTGHLADQVIEMDQSLVNAAIARWTRILNSPKEIPDREYHPVKETKYNRSTRSYDPTGRMILPFQCSYCPFKFSCYKNLQVDTSGSKPVFLTQMEEPV